MSKLFEKGDKVLIKASVYTKDRVSAQRRPCEFPHEIVVDVTTQWGGVPRRMRKMKYSKAIPGIIVGWSLRKTGEHIWSRDNEGVGELRQEKNHKVLMVQPTDTQRWVHPIPCLPQDLEFYSPLKGE